MLFPSDAGALQQMVDKHCGGAAAEQGAGGVGSHMNLNQFIDLSRSECLNESDDHTFQVN